MAVGIAMHAAIAHRFLAQQSSGALPRTAERGAEAGDVG